MTETTICPRCEYERPAELELCPQCALKEVVEAKTLADPSAASRSWVEKPGDQVGPFTLLEEIGEGGFAKVFLAGQSEPVKRRVAFKIIKPGMDSEEVMTRFEAERQALANMEHPGIAKLFEGGCTEIGRPYFVMELVEGAPITEFCDREKFGVRKRLELFREICDAVQHAHQKGVIHRDLKPSNILLMETDSEPAVKVIDFGIAKSLGPALTEATLLTAPLQVIGTPHYMSPEQARPGGRDVDTRSDIYSLGVLLYELLTGKTPFARERFREGGKQELLRLIREEDPPKPSARLARLEPGELEVVAADRGETPVRLVRRVRGELDVVVMKALRKDQDGRYTTASEFAEDIRRYLVDEPVTARSQTASYRLRKFGRRHRRALTAAAVIAATLVVATVVSIDQAVRARADRDRARLEQGLSLLEQARTAAARKDHFSAAVFAAKAIGFEDYRGGGPAIDEYPALISRQRDPAAYQLAKEVLGDSRARCFLPVWASPSCTHSEIEWDAGMFQCLDVSPDGNWLASGANDRLVRLWRLDTGELVNQFEDTYTVDFCDFSSDSQILAYSTKLGSIARAVSIPDGKNVDLLPNVKNPRSAISFLQGKGNFFAHTRVLEKIKGEGTEYVLPEDGEPFIFNDREIRFNHDGSKVAFRVQTAIAIHDFKTERTRQCPPGSGEDLNSLAFGPDGVTLLSTYRDRESAKAAPDSPAGSSADLVRLWDSDSGEMIAGFSGPVTPLALGLSDDGRRLMAVTSQEALEVYDTTTGKRTRSLPLANIGTRNPEWLRIAFTPSQDRVIIACRDWVIRIFSTETGEQLGTKSKHEGRVHSVGFSPDGERIVSGGADGTIQIRDTRSGKLIRTLEGHAGAVYSAFFLKSGMELLSAGADHTARLWNPATGEELARFTGHEEAVLWAAVSPDESLVATASSDGTVRLWNREDQQPVATLSKHEKLVACVCFDPSGERLASAGSDGEIHVWDIETRSVVKSFFGREFIDEVSFSPDGNTLASAGDDNTVRLWPMDGESEPKILRHDHNVTSLAFSPDGHWLATTSNDGHLRLWRVDAGELVSRIYNHEDNQFTTGDVPVAFSPQGNLVATGSPYGNVQLWRTPNRTEFAFPPGEERSLISADIDSQEGWVAGITDQRSIALWDLATGHPEQSIPISWNEDRGGFKLADSQKPGSLLVAGRKSVALVEIPSGQVSAEFNAESLAVTSESPVHIVGWQGGDAVVLDSELQKCGRIHTDGTYPTRYAAVSGDRKTVILAGPESIDLWDLESGHKAASLNHDIESNITAIALSRDGRWLGLAAWDGSLLLFDVAARRLSKRLAGKGSLRGSDLIVSSIAFTPGGTTMATGSADGKARLWDTASGRLIEVLPGYIYPLKSLRFTDGGKTIFLCGEGAGGANHTPRSAAAQIVIWSRLESRPDLARYLTDGWISQSDVKVMNRFRDDPSKLMVDFVTSDHLLKARFFGPVNPPSE